MVSSPEITENSHPPSEESETKKNSFQDQASQQSNSPGAPSPEHDTKDVEQPSLPNQEEPALPAEDAPPLPDEPPPLPSEAPPSEATDDGWQPMWDEHAQAYYFYNRFTNVSQWENPRVPEATQQAHDPTATLPANGGYNPAIHGDYDPNADYAQPTITEHTATVDGAPGTEPTDAYAATGAFNRFTGKWQNADFTPDRFSDAAKSGRQMSAFFDVDAAANTHDGRSLKAERANKKISKKELQAFKDKRREKKEEKRRAWLR